MLITVLSFCSLFLLRSIFLTFFYEKSLVFLYPLEVIGLIISSKQFLWSKYFSWILLGWIGMPDEMGLLNSVDDYQWWYIFLSWILCFAFYQIYYLIKNRKCINKWTWYRENLKFLLVNYLPIYLWNLNRIMHIHHSTFWPELCNLLTLCSVVFCIPSLLFYLIYGEKLSRYRLKMSFLIKYYKPKYKGFVFINLIIKNLTGIFLSFFYFWKLGNNYSLLILNLLYLLLVIFTKPFKKILSNKLSIYFNSLSLIVLIISEVENHTGDYLVFLILKAVFAFIYLISIFIYLIKYNNYRSIEPTN